MTRALLFGAGVLTLTSAWLGLFSVLLPGPFAAHMTMHMAVVAVAAPLLALGLAGTRFDPVPHAPRVFAALPASIVELVLVWGWHTPALHHAARSSALAFVLEQGSFLGSGLWLWLSAFGGGQRGRAERDGAGIIALLLTCMHMTLLGALLALPPRPLYVHSDAREAYTRAAALAPAEAPGHAVHVAGGAHEGAVHAGAGDQGGVPSGAGPARDMLESRDAQRDASPGAVSAASVAALEDQHLGGAIMILLGAASYLAGGLWLARGLLRRASPSAAGGVRTRPAELGDP